MANPPELFPKDLESFVTSVGKVAEPGVPESGAARAARPKARFK